MLSIRSQRTRFVILFPGRVGSTYLLSALDHHSEVKAMGEHLQQLRHSGAEGQLEWARRVLLGRPLARHRAVGFKTKLKDVLDRDRFATLLCELDVRVIMLDRRNDVKQAVSRVTARRLQARTGRWNRYAGDAELEPIRIEPAEFETWLSGVVRGKAVLAGYVASLGVPCLHLRYEDLLAEPDDTFTRVLRFLGVRPVPMTAATLKNTSDNLRDVIANFDELRSHYVGTPYAAMFDEAAAP